MPPAVYGGFHVSLPYYIRHYDTVLIRRRRVARLRNIAYFLRRFSPFSYRCHGRPRH